MNFTNFIRAQSLALAIVVLTVALAIKADVLASIQFYVVGVVGLLVIFHQVCLILISCKRGQLTDALWQGVVIAPCLVFTYSLALEELSQPPITRGALAATRSMFEIDGVVGWIAVFGIAVSLLAGLVFGMKYRQKEKPASTVSLT